MLAEPIVDLNTRRTKREAFSDAFTAILDRGSRDRSPAAYTAGVAVK